MLKRIVNIQQILHVQIICRRKAMAFMTIFECSSLYIKESVKLSEETFSDHAIYRFYPRYNGKLKQRDACADIKKPLKFNTRFKFLVY